MERTLAASGSLKVLFRSVTWICAGGDDLDLAPLAPGDQRRLGRHAVDAVDHRVQLHSDVLSHGLAGDEVGYRMDHTGRVDGADALGHHLHLGLADTAGDGMHLAVDVGDADVVQVEQGNLPDPGACQRFGRPGTDAADADHGHMGGLQAREAFLAVEAGDTAESFVCHLVTPSPTGGRRAL